MQPKRHSPRIRNGTLASVIRTFMLSPKFDALSKSTRISYTYLLGKAERPETLGAYEVENLRPALVQAFLDGFADRPATQRIARSALKAQSPINV